MNSFFRLTRKFLLPVSAAGLALVISGSGAVSTTSNPTVDLSVGPVAINSQAVNIALALSVEFPTVGAAYRGTNYSASTTYIGYHDPEGCYTYKDLTSGAPLGGEYFYRTGSVDSSGYLMVLLRAVGVTVATRSTTSPHRPLICCAMH